MSRGILRCRLCSSRLPTGVPYKRTPYEAMEKGWRRPINGRWLCPKCIMTVATTAAEEGHLAQTPEPELWNPALPRRSDPSLS